MHDLNLVLEAINGELLNLQASSSPVSSSTMNFSSAQIIDIFLNKMDKTFADLLDPSSLVDYLTDIKSKHDEQLKEFNNENRQLQELVNDSKKKVINYLFLLILLLKINMDIL